MTSSSPVGVARLLSASWRGGALLVPLCLAVPCNAHADQTLLVADNAEVQCEASLKDLTRISLKDDQFASVSKITSANASDDFAVVNEPIRGDIYLSVPETYSHHMLSFFGTTRRGYVYKFACTLTGDDARQVFITNADIDHLAPEVTPDRDTPSDEEAATRLVRAMAGQLPADGFEVRWQPLVPVMVGPLRIQALGEYRGTRLSGRILRLENRGTAPVRLLEEAVGSAGSVAVSIANPDLAPNQVTTAYIVDPTAARGARP